MSTLRRLVSLVSLLFVSLIVCVPLRASGKITYLTPKEKAREKLSLVVYIDDHFTPMERFTVVKGIHEWVRAGNGMISVDDRYGWTSDEDMRDIPKPNAKGVAQCSNTVHIARAWSDFPLIKEKEEKYGPINGTSFHDCNVKFIVLVMDRIETPEQMQQTTTHEFGHILGLLHTPVPYMSVMYPDDGKPAQCVTEIDLLQLCDDELFDCDVRQLAPCVPSKKTK